MNGSGKVRVLKADKTVEPFDDRKLAAAMWRAMSTTGGKYRYAADLAEAIGLYLNRHNSPCVSSAAVFEMAVKALRHVGLAPSAAAMEADRRWRHARRRRMRVMHEAGRITLLEKGWLSYVAKGCWNISRPAARTLAGNVERKLLAGTKRLMPRQDVLDMLNEEVAAFGLADAVPVQMAQSGHVG